MGAKASTVASEIVNPLSDFYAIASNFKTFKDLQQGLKAAGLESSELIVGIDFTKSNLYNGANTFNSKSLHFLSDDVHNPYEVVLQNICTTLAAFDDDNQIPCYGFGDVTSRNTKVFSFLDNEESCNGLESVKAVYRQLAQIVSLAGPTSFAPIIRKSIQIVAQHEFRYHVLLIIADGQVTDGDLTDTKNAIVEASNFAISIIMVGVGDGPWEMMQTFDDELPKRRFDNFQFVCLTEALKECRKTNVPIDIGFALQALQEIPEQYQLIRRLNLMDEAVGAKYLKKINLKPVQCVGPPKIRLSSNDSSNNLLFGVLESEGSGGGGGGRNASRNEGSFDPIYVKRSLTRSASTGDGIRTGGDSKRKKSMRRASSTGDAHNVSSGGSNGSSGSGKKKSPSKHRSREQGDNGIRVAPDDFFCPITQELMQDPVIAQDGHTYERSAIESWFQHGSGLSPMTNQPLPNDSIIPNFNLKSQISSWKAENGNGS